MIAMLAGGLGLMPLGSAFADQVLEVPSNASAVSAPVAPSEAAPTHRRQHRQAAAAPMPANLGSLQDYERETEQDPSTGAGGNFAGGSNFAMGAGAGNPIFEINGNNRQSLAQNALLGVLMIGLFAMQANAAHHHHHSYPY